MEYKKAYDFLYEKSLEKNFLILADHIKTVGPLKIKLSKMNFVDHLSKIIVGQQLSVRSAAAIWARTEEILKKNRYKKINERLNKKFKNAGLSRQKIEYLNGIIFNKELLPFQSKEISKQTYMKISDRTELILEIFKKNAQSKEAHIQIELARLKYELPRIAGTGKNFSQISGGISSKGPGEKKIEQRNFLLM